MTLPLLTSRLLPVPHGFSLREGGVSQGLYASLNLSVSTGDSAAHVAENLLRLARRAGVAPGRFFTVSQVHGDGVARVPGDAGAPAGAAPGDLEAVPPPFAEADALWTDAPGTAVGVKTADCVPVLLSDAEGRRVMAVHSGWKGTALRIAARAVEALERAGAAPRTLTAAIGPSIRACCYEVSEDVAGRFRQGFGEQVVVPPPAGKLPARTGPHLDLVRAVRHTLTDAGLLPERVDVVAPCTACDPMGFFSHRRDSGRTGRHLSFIVAR